VPPILQAQLRIAMLLSKLVRRSSDLMIFICNILRIFWSICYSADTGDLTCFVSSLKKATPPKDNILAIEANRKIAKLLGVSNWNEKFFSPLICKDYERLWHDISAKFQEQNFISNFLVTGTRGIGKSLFRWYLV
jgi:hypothetical protein